MTRQNLKICAIVELTLALIMSAAVAVGAIALVLGAMLCWTVAGILYIMMPEDLDEMG